MKLLPLLCTSLGMMCAHTMVLEKYNKLLSDIKDDNFDLLDECHHYTSGFKSVFSDYTMKGLFTIRQSVGGAGYSAWSGLPYIIEEFSPTTTFEGDNTVMAQQAFRFLQKQVKKVKKGETLEGLFTYINEISIKKKSTARSVEDFCDIDTIDETFKQICLF